MGTRLFPIEIEWLISTLQNVLSHVIFLQDNFKAYLTESSTDFFFIFEVQNLQTFWQKSHGHMLGENWMALANFATLEWSSVLSSEKRQTWQQLNVHKPFLLSAEERLRTSKETVSILMRGNSHEKEDLLKRSGNSELSVISFVPVFIS